MSAKDSSQQEICNCLLEFGEDLEMEDTHQGISGQDYKISLVTENPTMIFDICGQFGKIKSIRINEEGA